jgi:enoyl-CoA hydratase/carnithine racemase
LVSEVVPRAELRERARAIALSIAERNPKAIQGTVRAIWVSLDMPRTTALQHGLAYTQIGNDPAGVRSPRRNDPPTYR